MYLLLNTSTPLCQLWIGADLESLERYEWQADRNLADGLLEFIITSLARHSAAIHDLVGIGIYPGPGSFTGLRIGITVANTLSDSLTIPIVGQGSDNWQQRAIGRLFNSENDRLVLPTYGSEAHITAPRK